ncbi:MAG: UDP-N-acetylmuramoyl-tripeptide--D-alanyl-D-alanine ligase [Candidatus Omnitrophica bacterium]|nr:UDP-N-acetylmuramoyl-tripeptide--D-alanyl-D-alanine ligase [Candidatus Omnitrophota bacterium]
MEFKDFKQLERILKPSSIRNIFFFKAVKGFSIDSRTLKKEQGYIAIKGRYQDGHDFIQDAVSKGASFVVAQELRPISRKVPYFVVDNTYNALFDICRFVRIKKKPLVVAITGSVGKSTTKEMLSFLLRERFSVLKNEQTENNFLGLAKTILNLDKQKILILELGTNSIGEIELLARMSSPDIGVITFIKPVHLQGLKSLEGVYQEKLSLFKVNKKMKAVLNKDDAYLCRTSLTNRIFWFGKSHTNHLSAAIIKREKEHIRYLIQGRYELKLPLHQENFLANILAALLTAKLLKLPLGYSIRKINCFENILSMRMQVKSGPKALIINDAYNANPYSCQQGLKTVGKFNQKKIAVLADMLELGSKEVYYHKLLAKELVRNKIDYCLTYGPLMKHLKEQLSQIGYDRAYHFKSHKSIADFINKKIEEKDIFNKGFLVFLKGSRKMRLEKVLDYIKF